MPNIYFGIVQMMMRVVFFDKIKNYLMPYNPKKYSGFDYAMRVGTASFLCTMFNLTFSYPLDLIHTRTCADMSRKDTTRLYKTTFQCFNRTNLDEGRRSLYKGFEVALAQAGIRSCLQLPIYAFVRDRRPVADTETAYGRFVQRMSVGLVSGSLVTLLVYPFDTIKKCMQTNGGRGFFNQYTSPIDAFNVIRQKQGTGALYRGAHLYLMSSVISSVTQFTVYD